MRPTKGLRCLARGLSAFRERDARPRSAVASGLDLEPPAGVLDAAADHGQTHVAGPDSATGLLGIDADPVVVDLQYEVPVAPGDVDLDRRWSGVLDRVDHELLGNREQQGA